MQDQSSRSQSKSPSRRRPARAASSVRAPGAPVWLAGETEKEAEDMEVVREAVQEPETLVGQDIEHESESVGRQEMEQETEQEMAPEVEQEELIQEVGDSISVKEVRFKESIQEVDYSGVESDNTESEDQFKDSEFGFESGDDSDMGPLGSDTEAFSDTEGETDDSQENVDGEVSDDDGESCEDWSPEPVDLAQLVKDRQAKLLVRNNINCGRRGKLYAECCSQKGKNNKVERMLLDNTDHGLNLAFAKRVLRDENDRQAREEEVKCEIVGSRLVAALSLIKNSKLSRDQYLGIKYWLEARAQQGEDNISLPSWERIREEQGKAVPKGWPAEGEAVAGEAKIGLQALIDHTVTR